MKPTTEYIFDVLVQEKRCMRSRLNALQAKYTMLDKLGKSEDAEEIAKQCKVVGEIIDHFVETYLDIMETVQGMEVESDV